MLGERFDRLFRRLVERRHAYDLAPREPQRVVELASAWMGLDDARKAMTAERELVAPAQPHRPERPPRRIALDDDAYAALRVRTFWVES